MIKGTYLNLYSMADTIGYQTCILREDNSVPHGEGLVDDSNVCRVVWVAKSTYLSWDANEQTAKDIATQLGTAKRYVNGKWVLRSKYEAITALVETVDSLFTRATFGQAARYEVRHSGNFLVQCREARATLREYNETLDAIETMLEVIDYAVAATLSPVR